MPDQQLPRPGKLADCAHNERVIHQSPVSRRNLPDVDDMPVNASTFRIRYRVAYQRRSGRPVPIAFLPDSHHPFQFVPEFLDLLFVQEAIYGQKSIPMEVGYLVIRKFVQCSCFEKVESVLSDTSR